MQAEGNIVKSAWINTDNIVSVEATLRGPNKTSIEMQGGIIRYDVRTPEDLLITLAIYNTMK